ncbi:MAG: Nicotinate dehydrogenase FAD-subunit [Alphaproteobacteria bacterium MarineAlpha11_Bin1]|nr:MAG: Nicotinate dehydrogenase FAD-subunit [Alphaproteobacteria bacterium MarineAlpha11_Bin1]|tara:strand:- start:1536 stop:2372 length:837 start_codon:yes stop_codon:yes gene_type:complete
MSSYVRPTTLSDALGSLAEGRRTIVAGGTDFYPARVGTIPDEDVLDITSIDGLRLIEDKGDHYFIGAAATWTDLIRADLPDWFSAMKLAAREVGGQQIQNAGTVVGNVCNASPAADGVPGLIALEAIVRLVSVSGERDVPISEFILGNRRTARDPIEMVTGLVVPKFSNDAKSTFLKLGARKYLVISIVMVSAIMEKAADGAITRCNIAVGSCSEVAKRLRDLEVLLVGNHADASVADLITTDHLSPLSPIGDVRGSADYRLDAALTLVRRALVELAG